MAITAYKTWSSGEVLTAADLNSSFSQIINNPIDLWSPATKAMDFGGFAVTNVGAFTTTGAALFASATVTGAFVANGAVTLGDAIGDTVTIGGVVHKNATGNWTIPAPSSGTALTVNAVSGGAIAEFAQANAATAQLNFKSIAGQLATLRIAGNGTTPGTTSFDIMQDASSAYLYQRANLPVVIGTNNSDRVTVAAAGNVTIAAPTIGSPLTLYTPVGYASIEVRRASTAYGFIGPGDGVLVGGSATSMGITGIGSIELGIVGSAPTVTITSGRNVTIAAPSSGDALTVTGNVLANGTASVIGYGTGSGGTVTQITSKATAVTLNKGAGQIITHNAALGANTAIGFLLNDSLVAATDSVYPCLKDSTLSLKYRIETDYVVAGQVGLRLTNITAGSLSEAVTFNFVVLKGVTA